MGAIKDGPSGLRAFIRGAFSVPPSLQVFRSHATYTHGAKILSEEMGMGWHGPLHDVDRMCRERSEFGLKTRRTGESGA